MCWTALQTFHPDHTYIGSITAFKMNIVHQTMQAVQLKTKHSLLIIASPKPILRMPLQELSYYALFHGVSCSAEC